MELYPYSFTVFVLYGIVYAEKKQERDLFDKIIVSQERKDESSNSYNFVLDCKKTIKIICEGYINSEGKLEERIDCQLYQINENYFEYDKQYEKINLDEEKNISFPMSKEDYHYLQYGHYNFNDYTFYDYLKFIKKQIPSIPKEYLLVFIVHLQRVGKISPRRLLEDEDREDEYILLSRYFKVSLLPFSEKFVYSLK